MPFIYLNYIYSTIFNILLIFISIYNAPYQYSYFSDSRFRYKKALLDRLVKEPEA